LHGNINTTVIEQEVDHEIKHPGQSRRQVHKLKGKIKQVAGKAVGNRDLEAEGKAENVDGKVKKKIGEINDVVGK
jgi:uncharacterized protein YjbJ (UPF0337 family)